MHNQPVALSARLRTPTHPYSSAARRLLWLLPSRRAHSGRAAAAMSSAGGDGWSGLTLPPASYAEIAVAVASFPRSGNSLLRSLVEKVGRRRAQSGRLALHLLSSAPASTDITLRSHLCAVCGVGVVSGCQFTGHVTGSDNVSTTLLSQDLIEMGLQGAAFASSVPQFVVWVADTKAALRYRRCCRASVGCFAP